MYQGKKIYCSFNLHSFFIAISAYFASHDPRGRDYFTYTYYVFILNCRVIFPIIVAIFFTNVLVKEFEKKTARIHFLKPYGREKALLYKYIAGSVIISIIFILTFFVYELILLIVFKIKGLEIFNIYEFSFKEFYLRAYSTLLLQIVFLITFGAMVFIIGIITKKGIITILISLLILISEQRGLFLDIIPKRILFLSTAAKYNYMLQLDKMVYISYLYDLMLNISTLLGFILISFLLIRRIELD
nr:ABC transporter permease subunit [Caloramator sp. ALD01]